MTKRRFYVDESKTKANGFLLVAVGINHSDSRSVRAAIDKLRMPGQSRLHLRDESATRRRLIADSIARQPLTAWAFRVPDSTGATHRARIACIRRLAQDAITDGTNHLVIEQDDGMIRWDNETLIEVARANQVRDEFRWDHLRPRNDILLGIPDAVAWCYGRRGFHSRVAHLIERDVTLSLDE